MAEFDAGFKIVTRASGDGLTRLAGVAQEAMEPIGDTLQTTERLADRAFRARNGDERFVIYVEAYTFWVESAVWSVLAKSALLSERERLPTCSLVFVLMPKGYRSQRGKLRLQVGGKATQQVWFREVCLWRQKPASWWEHYPGLMALYPLCDHGKAPEVALVHAAESIRHHALDSYLRADLLATLGFFGMLKSRTLDVWSLIGREQMSESAFYQAIEKEVGQRQARKDLLKVVNLRFGSEASQEFEEPINRLSSMEQLDKLLEVAIKSRRVSQFRAAFPKE